MRYSVLEILIYRVPISREFDVISLFVIEVVHVTWTLCLRIYAKRGTSFFFFLFSLSITFSLKEESLRVERWDVRCVFLSKPDTIRGL